ncbi:MAG: GAF domain-containing protein, partial [Oscillatoriales cyanobacterium SM2_1_8]|nr:GAF domain-containing protein [Oscillatoriales cyanobacterium SM2_1_8]
MDRTVAEIQELLQCDRVLIYKILEDGSGVTIAEARVSPYSSFLGTVFAPEVLPEGVQQAYRAGRIAALHNSKGMSPCMVDFMDRYQIQSKLVVPLMVGDDLWGLVVMQHCAQSHTWADWEMDLMSQLSMSLAIAIRQSELFDRGQSELQARRQAEAALQVQAAGDRLLAHIAQRIGQSPYLMDVLDSTLATLRQFLQADRVVVYRFLPNWSGIVECEAVSHPRLSLVGQEIPDPCFAKPALQQRYRRGDVGDVSAVADVLTQGDRCYRNLMAQLQVRAKLVAPIVQGDSLWGLVIVHDCHQVRRWNPQESQLLTQVATQIGLAGQKESLFVRIQQELQQKETLLKEVHHRVKNNLQIVTSLMRLQGESHGDAALQMAFLEGQNRIQTMALIHERLYRSDDLSQIDARTYFTELTQYLSQTYNAGDRRIEVRLELEPLHLEIDQAIPCGLIVNELVSNALKYAFPDRGGHRNRGVADERRHGGFGGSRRRPGDARRFGLAAFLFVGAAVGGSPRATIVREDGCKIGRGHWLSHPFPEPLIAVVNRRDGGSFLTMSAAKSSAQSVAKPSRSVLVVEDEAILAMDIESTLARLGYTLWDSVASGEEALAMMATGQPDLACAIFSW